MKVILTADVYKHGVAGEVVSVADGFARNYLIPKGLAAKATPGALKQSTKLRETVKVRRAQLDNTLNELARQIDGVELVFGRRAGSNGKLYGSVTTMELADALMEKTGVDINRRRISQQAMRELGEYDVAVRLGSEITPMLHVVIVREEDLEEFLAAKEAGDAIETEEAAPEEAGERIKELIEAAEASTETIEVVDEASEEAAEA
jgi:large subunit ribosomal protein L9